MQLTYLSAMRRGIDLKKIATGMNGASGAESKAVCTEAICSCTSRILVSSLGIPGNMVRQWYLAASAPTVRPAVSGRLQAAGGHVCPARAPATRDTGGLRDGCL